MLDEKSEERCDEALKRALRTPPKPHKRKQDEGGSNPEGDDETKTSTKWHKRSN